jgi:Flp pilus assembly CpaE family ATPase
VTTNELAALQATRRSLTYLDRAGADRSRVRLILNRPHADGLNREEVSKALAVAPFAAVCNDHETVRTALLEGKPSPPGSRFASDVRNLCRQLQGKPAASGDSSGAKKGNSWMRLFLSHKQALSKKT